MISAGLFAAGFAKAESTAPAQPTVPEQTLRAIYAEALGNGQAYENLRQLVADHPGRLSGSKSLEGAVQWAKTTLEALQLDRVALQDVMVPHWERGDPESTALLTAQGAEVLSSCALGGSGASPANGLLAEVIEVHSLDELTVLGQAQIAGKIVFFNRPMDPKAARPGDAYLGAGDQRTRGPAAAARLGAAGAIVRSLTQRRDDVPHTGVTIFPPEVPPIPAVAVSTLAADKLSAALATAKKAGPAVRAALRVNARWLPNAPSHNVIAEIRGSEFPEQILLVGGHLDSWDIAPGAHDDGAGVVQSIEVLRIFRALGIKPRHTVRCVLFVNEENGLAGATAYAGAVKDGKERHLLAMESDAGGFEPKMFYLGSTQGDAAARAAKWLPLFKPYGLLDIQTGNAGSDVTPLMILGATVGELAPNSQRYFDIHHTREDSIDKVNPRELHLGAAAIASLVWLFDTQGL